MMPNFLILIKKLMLTVIALMLMVLIVIMAALLMAISICAWCLSRFFPQFRNSAAQTDGAPMSLKELRRDIKKGNSWIPKDFNPKN
ncbi:hypothetical protein [Ferrovum sp.]|uniref:hypothetical protein n=1 Tax=Ferrovum sp. TaxID=2609467 RepID=UPI002622D5C7|nr:hypothetical protein [Ferrovum sp.]